MAKNIELVSADEKKSDNKVTVNVIPKLFQPGPFMTVLGGGIAYFSAPELSGLWALGAAAATGIVTGYGSRWGRFLGSGVGLVVGGLAGLILGGSAAAALSDKYERLEGTLIGSGLGAAAGGSVFAVCGAIAGTVTGSIIAYNAAKGDIDHWALRHQNEQHAATIIQYKEPTRTDLAKITAYAGNRKFIIA